VSEFLDVTDLLATRVEVKVTIPDQTARATGGVKIPRAVERQDREHDAGRDAATLTCAMPVDRGLCLRTLVSLRGRTRAVPLALAVAAGSL